MIHLSMAVLAADFITGDPPNRFHPTAWCGRLISFLEKLLYVKDGLKARISGSVLVIMVTCIWGGIGVLLEYIILRFVNDGIIGFMLISALASVTIACRSLMGHALPVLRALLRFDCQEARKKLSMIVGRDTEKLNRTEISRACVETVAESLGDGIISPLFYFAVFGLGGAFAYRAANTMDSMIGHKNERYFYFGWGAARFDDLLNWIPARIISYPALCIAAFFVKDTSGFSAIKKGLQEHGAHKSPNSGWLEASAAGALNVRTGGKNSYQGEILEYPLINIKGRDPKASDIRKCTKLIMTAAFCGGVILDAAALLTRLILN